MSKVTREDLDQRIRELEDLEQMTGTSHTVPDDAWGPPVRLWRTLRTGRVVCETLPRWLAHQILAAIPECEPGVARAWIKEGR